MIMPAVFYATGDMKASAVGFVTAMIFAYCEKKYCNSCLCKLHCGICGAAVTVRRKIEYMKCNLAVIKGDGIGPEIVEEAMKVLDAVGEKYGHTFSYEQILMGGASIDVHGKPLTDEALEIARNSDAVLMGSIGGDTSTSPWYQLPAQLRPEAGL